MKQNMNIGFVQTNLACNCLQEQLKNIAKFRVQHVKVSHKSKRLRNWTDLNVEIMSVFYLFLFVGGGSSRPGFSV